MSGPALKSLLLATTGAAVLATSPMPAIAQGEVDTIMVTARKREESLQNVPISVQAYDGATLERSGVIDIQSLSGTVPNFSYSQAVGASDVLIMRGLGSVGSGPHLEQAVGQVFNGFFTTRSRLGRSALVDVGQVEVLRGPQGPIIGKNTSLGAVVVTPNKPGDDVEFIVSGGYNFEASEGFEVQGVASGPLGERVRARLMVNYRDMDGWMENAPTGDDHRTKEDIVARFIGEMDVTQDITAELLYQRTDYDRVGKPREIFCLDPQTVFANDTFAGEDCTINARNNSLAVLSGDRLGTGVDVVLEEGFQLESDLTGLTVNWDIAGATVTSVTAFNRYEMFDLFDSDLTAVGPRVIQNFEDYQQFTQELRIVSNGGELFDYIAGVNYFDSSLFFTQDFDSHPGAPTEARRRHEEADVETDAISAFGQVDWHVTDQIDIIGGVRWTSEERSGFKDQWQNIYGTDIRDDARCGPPTSGLLGCFAEPLVGDIDETNTSWNVGARWMYAENSMLYATAATGFKSGGFNIRGNVSNEAGQDAFVFASEESINYEIGGKHTLLDNSLRVNWTVYHMEVEDLQLSSNDPETITQAVVPGDASADGVEFDILWAATDALTLGLVGAYNNTEYDRFLSSCYTVPTQTFDQGCNVDINGDGAGDFQDLSGETPPFAPDYTIAITGDYTMPVFDNMLLTFGGQVYTVGEQSLDVVAHPIAQEDAYTKLDLTVTLAEAGDRWSVSITGKNLTDEIVRNWSEPTTSFNAVGGGHYAFIDETRSIKLRGRLRF